MSSRSLQAAVIGAVCVFLGFGASPSKGDAAVRSNPSPATFTDTAGDSGTAADISSVVVSSDSTGQITFQVNFSGPLPSGDLITVLVDADNNPATGDTGSAGAEYALGAVVGGNAGLFSWNGSSWVPASSQTTFTANQGTTQVTFSVNRSDLGGTSQFGFWVDSADGDGGAGHEDQAPDNGTWNYQLTAPMHLSVVFFNAQPVARAGKTYFVAMAAQRSDTGDFLGAEGTLTCTATLGGKRVHGFGAFVTATVNGAKVSAAGCEFRLPKNAAGKTLRGTMTLSYQGAQAVRHFKVVVHRARR
jgi:hypothetical protein